MNPATNKFALANVSIGLAFLVALVVPLGSIFVENVLSGPVLWDMTGIARQLPGILGNYWLPAIAIYFLLRQSSFLARYSIPDRAHLFFRAGNVMLITYLLGRVGASTIPGGGAGFVVAAIGSLLLALPGYGCLVVGLVLAVSKRSSPLAGVAEGQSKSQEIGVLEGVGIIVVLAIPLASILWLYEGAVPRFE